MKTRTLLFAFLALLTALRLFYIAQTELSADEAYYYLWSQHPDLSYYSKGPGVAMAIRFSTSVFGANEFGVRWLSPLLALGTSLVMFSFARRIYGESVAVWTVLTMNAIPIFNVGALVMTIDPLSIFFWAAALYTFWLALEKSPAFGWWWPFTGLLIGLGFLAKYTNAMQLLSIVLVLAFTKKYRREFSSVSFWSMLIVFLACTTPVVIWNAQHSWITLTHLRSRGNIDTAFDPSFWKQMKEPFEFLGAHLGVYSPLIFIAMMMALWWSRNEAARKFKPRFLALFALPLLVMYGLLSLKKAGQANWTAPAFVSLGILAPALWHEAVERNARWKKFVVPALAVGMVMSFAILGTDAFRAAGIPFSYKLDPGSRLRGWKTTAITVGNFRKKFERDTGKPAFLIGNKSQTASLLSFYLPDPRSEGPGHPPVYTPESQDIESEFAFWPRYDEFVATPAGSKPAEEYYTEEQGVNLFTGRNALYISDEVNDEPPSAIERGFERVEMVALLDIRRRGLPLRTVRIFACYNYRTISL
jgi:hypothetical protein